VALELGALPNWERGDGDSCNLRATRRTSRMWERITLSLATSIVAVVSVFVLLLMRVAPDASAARACKRASALRDVVPAYHERRHSNLLASSAVLPYRPSWVRRSLHASTWLAMLLRSFLQRVFSVGSAKARVLARSSAHRRWIPPLPARRLCRLPLITVHVQARRQVAASATYASGIR
jgi:hypothetical protein